MRLILLAAVAASVLMPSQLSAKWYEAKSRHFTVYSEQDPDELKTYATRLERYDGAIRAVRGTKGETSTGPVTVYVLKTAADVGELYGSDTVLGFYRAPASGPVAFINSERKKAKNDLDGLTVFFHEYIHHLMLRDPTFVYPTWMSEGYAEFFSTAQILDDGSVEFGEPPRYRGQELFNLNSLSLTNMVGANYVQLTSDEFISMYSQGWLLTHYLAFEPSRRGQVDRYIADMHAGMAPMDAAKQAFGDLRRLDGELGAYLKRKTVPTRTIPASMINVGPVTIRPLGEDEEAVVKVRLHLDAGAEKGAIRYFAGSARGAAERFPKSLFVLNTAARAELMAENFEQGNSAADRALALDPNSVQALTYKGWALMGLAKDNPGAADWTTIRSYLAKANHLDPDAAEPLLYFYESYVKQGVKPPAQAVDGLLGALELAPEDQELRMLCVRQLLRDGDLKTARMLFAPVAYNAHYNNARRHVLEIMAKITSGDGPGALAMLDDDHKKSGDWLS